MDNKQNKQDPEAKRMRLKIISCDVLFREVCLCAAHSRNILDLDFLPKGLHDNPDIMRTEIQKKIDETKNGYDALLLGYALCSNGIVGVKAREIPLVIPRAHDCITLFLGSRDRYIKYFNDHPGTYYYTSGWFERSGMKVVDRSVEDGLGLGKLYEEYVKKYGEDNAKFLMEFENSWLKNYSRVTFIDIDFVKFLNYNEEAKKIAEQRNWNYDELSGDISLIKKLIDGEWNEDEFMIVQPEEEIIATYDNLILGCKNSKAKI